MGEGLGGEPGRPGAGTVLLAAFAGQELRRAERLASRLLRELCPGAPPHPELRDQTVWSVFKAERPSLVPYVGRFDGFHAVTASVSKTCLVRFDNNRYSVSAHAVGRPVEVRAYAERIELRQGGKIVGDLLTAEISEKQAKSIRYQITIAKLPLAKDVDDFTLTARRSTRPWCATWLAASSWRTSATSCSLAALGPEKPTSRSPSRAPASATAPADGSSTSSTW